MIIRHFLRFWKTNLSLHDIKRVGSSFLILIWPYCSSHLNCWSLNMNLLMSEPFMPIQWSRMKDSLVNDRLLSEIVNLGSTFTSDIKLAANSHEVKSSREWLLLLTWTSCSCMLHWEISDKSSYNWNNMILYKQEKWIWRSRLQCI